MSTSIMHTPWDVVVVIISASGCATFSGGAFLLLFFVIVCIGALGRHYRRLKKDAVKGQRMQQVELYNEEGAKEGEDKLSHIHIALQITT